MVCKLYGKPGEFLEENRDFLLENEALVQLNLGNAQTHREEGCHPGLLFGRYEEEGRMCLLFGNTAPWNICLNAPQGMEKSMEAAGELARYLRGIFPAFLYGHHGAEKGYPAGKAAWGCPENHRG